MSDRKIIHEFIRLRTGNCVQTGPFRGMKIGMEEWEDYLTGPKLLGTYEQELHDVIRDAGGGQYGAIVNIGCAEGYYAVGFARLHPRASVYAFDTDPNMIAAVKRNAALNFVAERIVAYPGCSPDILVALAERHGRLLVFCDCEGYEMQLFSSPAAVAALWLSDIVVECHDSFDPRCTPTLFDRLWDSHRIDIVYGGARDPSGFSMLSRFTDLQRWMVVCEWRPALMNWLVCRPR